MEYKLMNNLKVIDVMIIIIAISIVLAGVNNIYQNNNSTKKTKETYGTYKLEPLKGF